MFQLERRITDQGIYVEVTHLDNGKENIIKDTFQNPANADTFVKLKLQRYMSFRLKRYIAHSRQIANNSKSGYYNTIDFKTSLEVCCSLIRGVDTKTYHEISRMILDNYQHIWNIHPHRDNKSYSRSVATVYELKNLAEKYI